MLLINFNAIASTITSLNNWLKLLQFLFSIPSLNSKKMEVYIIRLYIILFINDISFPFFIHNNFLLVSIISEKKEQDCEQRQKMYGEGEKLNALIQMKIFRFSGKKRSHSAIATLTAIVIMYIICNIPRLIVNLFEHLDQYEISDKLDACGCRKQPKWMLILLYISHLLLTLNSSANFVIYYSTEWNFKRYLNNWLNKVRFIKKGNKREYSVRSDTTDLNLI